MAENRQVLTEEEKMQYQMPKTSAGIEIIMNDDATEVHAKVIDSSVEHTRRDVIWLLSEINVRDGIRNDQIEAMLDKNTENIRYLVAECKKPVDGKDGWFEFLFDTEIDTKPKILKDGSVDYSAYGDVPSVEEGQMIVNYHPATTSEDGENYFGEILLAVKGKELAKLKGKGFYISENGREYYAKFSGRATYQNDRLLVENELVIDGDASLSTGDIIFSNDIHIKGNVLTGVMIHSVKGSIIVDGFVEACSLEAGTEVVLKNGMQGNGKGKIVAGGNVSGKFFEQVTIESGGDVSANAIMNSRIYAKNDVTVSGKFGIIIGGDVNAEHIISATIVGNMAEVKTYLTAGVAENLMAKLMQVESETKTFSEDLQKITAGIERLEQLMEDGQRPDLNTQKLKLIRAKVSKENDINGKAKEKQEIMERMTRAHDAKVSVLKALYPGTTIEVNGLRTDIKDCVSCVEIIAKGTVIQMVSLV